MKRATMTIPDDLAEAMEQYVQAQEVPPALTTVVQVALREYLRERGFLQPYRRLKIEPVGRSRRRQSAGPNRQLHCAATRPAHAHGRACIGCGGQKLRGCVGIF